MKARVLVLAVNDGVKYVETYAIASERALDENPDWINEEQVVKALDEYCGAVEAHGFIDIVIPDDVIAQVLRRHADAGVVAAEAVES